MGGKYCLTLLLSNPVAGQSASVALPRLRDIEHRQGWVEDNSLCVCVSQPVRSAARLSGFH